MKKGKAVDVAFILAWPVIAALLSFLLQVNVFGATMLFMVVPGIYLSFRNRTCIARAATFSLICLPLLFAVEYFAIKNGAWAFSPAALFLPSLFGTVAFEAIIWYFAWVYLVIMYYEHFLDKSAHTALGGPRLKYLFFAFMAVCVSTLFLAIYALPATIPYYYLVLGILLIAVPVVLGIFTFPVLFTKLAKVTLYFTYLHLVMDLTEIALGHWFYPGQFIGWFELFGQRFPAEELFFFVILSAAAIIAWYQYFDETG